MGAFGNLISGWIRDRKIYFRVRYRYTKIFPGSRIQSILSASVEKLIDRDVVIEENVKIADDILSIGRSVYIGRNTTIASCAGIGNFTSISAGVRIGLMAHPTDFLSTSPVFYASRRGWTNQANFDESEGKKTVVGHDVLISANAMIRNGVVIGHGAIIGAGAFVDKDVEPYSIVAGIPAKMIRKRFDDALIERLLRSEWWNLPDETIRKAGNFSEPSRFLDAIGK
ncbi:MAG TPA: CatB-related O-acetyltransferase [Bacteroidia bacterium]|nr:CatB-related O-acetyltransferase [Bacteroidia bacterium]